MTETTRTETDALAEILRDTAEPWPVFDADENVRAYKFIDGDTIDLDPLSAHPKHYESAYNFDTRISFLEWVRDHITDPATVAVYASRPAKTFVAVLDDHTPDAPGWRRYRAHYSVGLSPEWVEWVGRSGEFFSGAAFAEIIEDNTHLIADPDSAALVDLVRGFIATRKSTFGDEINDTNGDVSLQYKTETTTGELHVPPSLTLVLPVFEGEADQPVEARFRYRLNEGRATFGVRIAGVERIERNAFERITDRIADPSAEVADLDELAVYYGRADY